LCSFWLSGGDGPFGEPKEFVVADAGFKFKIPGMPKKETRKSGGSGIKFYTFTVENTSAVMAVSYADLPILAPDEDDVKGFLDASRQGILKKAKATLKRESNIKFSGRYPGREIVASLPDDKGELRARLYLVGTRVYQLMVYGKSSVTNSKEATTFLESLELTK
jgi:hypothetical protein